MGGIKKARAVLWLQTLIGNSILPPGAGLACLLPPDGIYFAKLNMISDKDQIKILISALAGEVIPVQSSQLIPALVKPDVVRDAVAIASQFDSPKLKRELTLAKTDRTTEVSLQPEFAGNRVIYQGQEIGRIQILYKSPLPGELQARLAIESAIDRFLEYLQKEYKIVVLDESDRHVKLFIPNKPIASFSELWEEFLKKVAFSDYGYTKYQLPGLIQTFIQMLNSVTLSGRGFSTLDVPILTQEQSNVLAAWYFAVVRDVGERQNKRQRQINDLENSLTKPDLDEKEFKRKTKDLQDKQAMQDKEAQKYTEYFQKSFGKSLEEQNTAWQELKHLETQLVQQNLTKTERRKLQKQQEKLKENIVFCQEFIQQKLDLFKESGGEPFKFVQLDEKKNPDKFKVIRGIAKNFSKTATDQINSTRGDIFTQCIAEMYRLLEMEEPSEPLPEPLLTEQPVFQARSPGDDSKEFCYSCGVALDPKTARWQVLRFMFERPSQRRQSASSEGRPHICASCSALAFASPLKVTDESIILRLKPADGSPASEVKIKDYIRMLTNKQMHLSAGRYLILTSEKTKTGEIASEKFGQVQYAKAKAASILPKEVLADFKFDLIIQGSQIYLPSRHLIYIKGLMAGYEQSIVISGEKINLSLGDAVRYVEQDTPVLAEYKLARESSFSDLATLEQTRARYYQLIREDVGTDDMNLGKQDQLPKKAKLYQDVAALTGLTYPFAESLEITVRDFLKKEAGKDSSKYPPERIKKEIEREVSKLIENVHDATYFCYYATKGDDRKTSVSAKLYKNRDNHFIYDQLKHLLEEKLQILDREKIEKQQTWLELYADDILKAYAHFAAEYAEDKDWKDLTYQLKLSLYTRFPEIVRKLKSTSEN